MSSAERRISLRQGSRDQDHDIATSASPNELAGFSGCGYRREGFRVLKIPLRLEGKAPNFLEIATFRISNAMIITYPKESVSRVRPRMPGGEISR
jgi:hypothetical protein